MSDKAVIGVDLGGTNVRVGKVQNNRLEKHFSRAVSSNEAENIVIQEIFSSIDLVFDNDAAGIGIGVPSVVDVEKGIVYTVENIPSWKEVYLKDQLESKYGVPAYINNDANCFALGESYFGKGRGFKDIVALTIGTGMGAGIIINNKLYNGINCGAGEFGNILYKDHNLEYYCSGQLFLRECGVGGDVICERAEKGDKDALALLEQLGSDLGNAIQTILYALDPEIIIFGGSVSKAFPFFEKSMRENMKSFVYQHVLKRLVIEQSEQANIPILGAAALYFDAQRIDIKENL